MARGYPDFEGQKQKVYLVPEWAAKEGTDKNFVVIPGTLAAFGDADTSDYTVPAGKTLIINDLGLSGHAAVAANAELNQIVEAQLMQFVGVAYVQREVIGGNGGGSLHLTKPRSFVAGTKVRLRVINWSNHGLDPIATMSGYEF